MNFAWAKRPLGAALAASALLALAACGRPAAAPEDLAKNAAESAAFMKQNATEEGVQTLPSGLQYKVVASGPAGGVQPDRNDLVKVDYEGTLTDGTVFDSSFERGAPYVTTPQDVIEGWKEGLQLMSVGDEWILYVPPELGYGERGGPPVIPPHAVLVFRVQLLDVAKTPGGEAAANG